MDELPEPIIQHILSFLTPEEAARKTVLSKSWRSAWLTQPNLVVRNDYDSDYCCLELARKTLQRYEESNQKIQSLTLCVNHDLWNGDLCNKLIAKSLKLGATHLNLDLESDFVLPHDIVFGSEKLVGLSVKWCKIEIGSSDQKAIRCSGLESLSLNLTGISLDTVYYIISSCPLIRNLSLSNFWHAKKGGKRSVGLGLMNLHSLTCLELVYVDFDTLFLGDMSSRFPSLKDLTLHTHSTITSQDKVIRISSRSLERLNFAQGKRVRYKFDVPSIRRFAYKGSDSPLLSFKSTSREWESRVSIKLERVKNIGRTWFRRLNKFLTKLRRSKISHLSLEFSGRWACFDYEAGKIERLSSRRPRVENLTVNITQLPNLNCYALFDGLFQTCRPKLITQHLHPPDQWRGARRKANSDHFLCRAFLAWQRGMSESQFLYNGLRDLEEVNAELFDKEMDVWRHVQLKSLLDDASTNDEQKNCIHDEETTSWATDDDEENRSQDDDEENRFQDDEEENRFQRKIRFQLKWKRKLLEMPPSSGTRFCEEGPQVVRRVEQANLGRCHCQNLMFK